MGLNYFFFLIYTKWTFHGNLWAKGHHLMEASYLKGHPLWDRYPKWTTVVSIKTYVLGDPKAP